MRLSFRPPSAALRLLPVLVLAAAGLTFALWPARPAPEEKRPRPAPSAEFVNVRASMDYYRARLREEPGVVRHYVALAQLHLQQARATGREAEHLGAARELLDEALSRAPDDFDALALKASLLNTLHRFDDARALAERLLARNPRHTFTHGVLVDALVETGNYEAAVRACDRMLALRPDLASYARAAYLRELHGDTDGAIAAMRMAADAGVPGLESRAWALYNLGMLYLGDARLDTAAFVFEGILEERPAHGHALAGLGRVALARGDHAGAISLFREAYDLEPRPAFLEALADAYAEAGDEPLARSTRARVRAAFEEARRMGEDVDMEYADFLAAYDLDAATALRLATRAYERRPDHLHVLETYAWALHANDRSAEAVPVVERALRLGTADGMLHYRAARIYASAGKPAEAIAHLRRALADNLHIESAGSAHEARALLARLTVES